MSIAVEDDPDIIDGVYYPSEDGKPMALTVVHTDTALELFALLRKHFRPDADVLVTCDCFWYWEKGNPKARMAPDVMVCVGVDGGRQEIRRCFIAWLENNVVPSICFEFASRGTWRKNLTVTKDHYERMGVPEYFFFDPDYKYIKAGLLGWRLKKGKYVEIDPDEDGSMLSKSLNFRLLPVGRLLRLVDPKTGEILPNAQEEADHRLEELESERRVAEEQRRVAEEQRRVAEEQRRVADEQRYQNAELQQEIERLRAQLQPKKPRTNGSSSKSQHS